MRRLAPLVALAGLTGCFNLVSLLIPDAGFNFPDANFDFDAGNIADL